MSSNVYSSAMISGAATLTSYSTSNMKMRNSDDGGAEVDGEGSAAEKPAEENT